MLFVATCFICMLLGVALNSYSNYNNSQSLLREGRTHLVNGSVTNYTKSTTGKDPGNAESFTVNGVRFSYSQHSESVGFHTPAKYGGPIREGLIVRIHYAQLFGDPSEPAILKLEIKR